jgi:hypothetical protein
MSSKLAKRSSMADQLITKHFDDDWKNTISNVRHNIAQNTSTYNPTSSWDGQSQDPIKFSRLQHAQEVAVQSNRPCTLSGSAVILLEQPEGMTVFNVKPSNNGSVSIPLTLEQREVGMDSSNFSAKIPLKELAESSNKIVVMDKLSCYRNMAMEEPQLRALPAPKFYHEAGPQMDQVILNPAQRREILAFEKKKSEADHHMKKAVTDRNKTRASMLNPQHNRGVLMVDTSDNINSEIYHQVAAENLVKKQAREEAFQKKQSYLSSKVSSMTTNGNILVPETVNSNVAVNKPFQTKGGSYHGMSFDETQERLFTRQSKPVDPERTQVIRDRDLGGRNYNLITGAAITTCPSKVEPKQDRILGHPSQASLEGFRNLQGALDSRRYW